LPQKMSRVGCQEWWDVVVELGFLKHNAPQHRPHHSDRHLAGNDGIEAHQVSRSWRAQSPSFSKVGTQCRILIAISGPFALPPLALGQIRKSCISRDWLECASLHATFQWRRSERLETWRGILEPHHLDCPSPTFLPRALRDNLTSSRHTHCPSPEKQVQGLFGTQSLINICSHHLDSESTCPFSS
jgi:hypothetical protein